MFLCPLMHCDFLVRAAGEKFVYQDGCFDIRHAEIPNMRIRHFIIKAFLTKLIIPNQPCQVLAYVNTSLWAY